jgi:hypothetical protein
MIVVSLNGEWQIKITSLNQVNARTASTWRTVFRSFMCFTAASHRGEQYPEGIGHSSDSKDGPDKMGQRGGTVRRLRWGIQGYLRLLVMPTSAHALVSKVSTGFRGLVN